jgi:hypothetical protein
MPLPSFDDVNQRRYDEKPKPRGWYSPKLGTFVDYGIPTGGGLAWGTRGYPRPGPVPNGMTADQARLLWKVSGALKRIWEYPSIARRFAAEPIDHLVTNSGVGAADIAALLVNAGDPPLPGDLTALVNKTPRATVGDVAAAVGMPLPPLVGKPLEEAAARLVLFMIHTIHEKKLYEGLECK